MLTSYNGSLYPLYQGAVVDVIVRWLDLQLPMQSVPITIKVSFNSDPIDVFDTTLCDKVCQ
jgi:hypothetical protein